MHAALKIFSGGKLATRGHRLRLLATVGTAVVIGAGATLAASPARADSTEQKCNSYHSWTECITFDYTTGYLSVSAYNGYSTAETEALWMEVGVNTDTETFFIPSHQTASFSWHAPGANDVCAGIDSIQIVCHTFAG